MNPWIEIQRSKINFLQYHEDPRSCTFIKQEVAESWIRSYTLGINPYTQTIDEYVDSDEITKILDENRMLIDITKSLFDNLKGIVDSSKYALYIFDKNGVLLFHEGDPLRLASNRDSMMGMVWNEKNLGTCAHVLSMQLKRPVHLLGPEHYCVALNNSSGSAAPILDENGEVIATLVLSFHLIDPPWEDNFLNLSFHTMGLVTTIAAAVEAQIKLEKSNKNLTAANDYLRTACSTLEATLASVDDPIITIDKTGMIIRSNQEGARILRLKPDQAGKSNIRDFLNDKSSLMAQAEKGENITIKETIQVGNEEQPYIINIYPVLNQKTKQLETAVLRLNHDKKIDVLTGRSGATAYFQFKDILGESKAIKKAIELGQRFALSQENILLTGESGTGKELFAQAIHNERHLYGPFMVVNCAALPKELIESELFGYEGGSFTGAERNGRPGKIELAHGGTLFLDEIGDMPLDVQAVLLRVLEDKQVMRLGGRRYKKVDFRVIAATNKNLYQLVQEKLFREDLYYRLAVLSLNLPPLRERENDAQILSQYFIENYCNKQSCEVPQLSSAAMEKILEYDWPGNVRQLKNAIIYAINTSQNKIINPENLPENVINYEPVKVKSGINWEVYSIDAMEKILIENALYKTRNNITRTAELLGIGKSTLYRKIKEYGIINSTMKTY